MKLKDRHYNSNLAESARDFIESRIPAFSSGEPAGTIYGALAGTALATVILTAATRGLLKDINKLKEKLDKTYNPVQRHLASVIEGINMKLVIFATTGGVVGSGAGYYFLGDKFTNKKVAISIGTYIGKKSVELAMSKKKALMQRLTLEYLDSLNYEQKVMRSELTVLLDKYKLQWSLGISGGIIMGGLLGDHYTKKNKQNQ